MNVAVVLCCVSFVVLQVNIATARTIANADSSSVAEEEEEELTPKEEACVDELHLDRQLIIDTKAEDIAPEDNTQFNEFMDCYWQKINWMESNGEINYDKIYDNLTEIAEASIKDENSEAKSLVKKGIKDVVDYCEKHLPSKGSSNGQTAVRARNCIMNELDELIEDLGFSSEEDEDDNLSSKEADCVDELHLNKDHIMKLNNRDIAPEDSDDFNKFLACYWVKEEWMDKNGEINYDNLLFSLRAMAAIAYQGETHELKAAIKKRIARAIDFCQNSDIKGDSYGQKAARVQNCIMAKATKGF